MKHLFALFLSMLLFTASAQIQEDSRITPFDRKFHAGISLNNYFTTVTGDNLPREYFTKPSIGFNLRAEYFFTSWAGVGVGLGYQQRGMGIINKDVVKTLGDPDSTYRERVRFHTIEIPLSLVLRTPKDVIKGIRLSGSIGIVPAVVFKSTDIFQSVEDGNHLITPVDDQYLKNDMLTQFTIGPEIDSGGTGIFQIHFVYNKGTNNVYAQGQGTGYNHSMGVRIAWLFGSKLAVKKKI